MGVKKIKGGYRVFWTDELGVARRHILRGVTKDEADAYLAREKQRVRDIKGGHAVRSTNPRNLTLDALAAKYVDGRDDKSISAIRCHIIGSELGKLRLERVTPDRIVAHLDALKPAPAKRANQKVKAKLAPRTKNHVRKHLLQIFRWAIKRHLFTGANPVLEVEPFEVKRKTLETLTATELVAVIMKAEQPWRGMIAVAAHGLRKGEIAGLDVADLDLAARIIHVRRSHDGETTKSGREREVPIHEHLLPFIREAVDIVEGRSTVLFPGLKKDKKTPNGNERRHPDADWSSRFRSLLVKAGIKRHLRFHDLRHTAATLLLRSGVQIGHVSKILGHASVAITVDLYGHLMTEDLHAAMAKVELPIGPRAAAEGAK